MIESLLKMLIEAESAAEREAHARALVALLAGYDQLRVGLYCALVGVALCLALVVWQEVRIGRLEKLGKTANVL